MCCAKLNIKSKNARDHEAFYEFLPAFELVHLAYFSIMMPLNSRSMSKGISVSIVYLWKLTCPMGRLRIVLTMQSYSLSGHLNLIT